MNALFQGDNTVLTLKFKDNNGSYIESNEINDIAIVLYLEHNKKQYLYWCLDGGTLYDRNQYPNLTAKIISKSDDNISFTFNIESSDSLNMEVGRYIVQVTYNVSDGSLTDGKSKTKYGALLTIKKFI